MEQSSSMRTVVVVIPTRNRADLAINAIQSVLQQPVDNVYVIVSDNSSKDEDRKALMAFCGELSDPRLLYIAPPRSLPMSEHWDWAMSQALQHRDAGHFVFLTDRSIFKPGELLKITLLARRYPDRVISYDWVTIFDQWSPIIVERQSHTGQVVEVSASRLLFLSSKSIFPRCLPRMMNSCIPRSVIERIQERFGSVFASTSPDFNFAYRCLEIVDDILYYDLAAFVSYAIHRSNGVIQIGLETDANIDFMATLDLSGRPLNYAAPVPAFETFTNYVIHEYCCVQRETGSHKFPRVCLIRYLFGNVVGLLGILAFKLPVSVLRILASLRTRVRKIFQLRWPTIARYETSPGFGSVQDAIDYAISFPPNGDESVRHLELLRD